MMRILVTGAAGFIGSHVWRALDARGHELVGIDALVPQVHGLRPDRSQIDPRIQVTTLERALSSQLPWPTVCSVDVIVHLAAEVGVAQSAYEPARYVKANVMETALLWDRVIELITQPHRRLRRMVVASSMSVYGEGAYTQWPEQPDGGIPTLGRDILRGLHRVPERGWDAFDDHYGQSVEGILEPILTKEEKVPEPSSVYALSKLDTERYSMLLGGSYNLETVALRLFNCFGPGQALANAYTGVLAGFACRVLNGRPPLVYEDGKQSRDFIHVDDVASAVVAAVEAESVHGVYNVATGIATSVGELAAHWCRIAADRGLPAVEPEILGKFRVGDVRHCIGDPTRFQRATGWEARRRLADGLPLVADWILANHFDVNVPVDHAADAAGELRAHGLER